MSRKKVSLAYIENEAERKSSYKKRSSGLMKKVSELSTLCGRDACLVISSEYDPLPRAWPSMDKAKEVLTRYSGLSEIERARFSLNTMSFTGDRIRKAKEQIARVQRANELEEIGQFLWKCRAGMTSLGPYNMNEAAKLTSFVKQKSDEIKFRMKEFRGDQLQIQGDQLINHQVQGDELDHQVQGDQDNLVREQR